MICDKYAIASGEEFWAWSARLEILTMTHASYRELESHASDNGNEDVRSAARAELARRARMEAES